MALFPGGCFFLGLLADYTGRAVSADCGRMRFGGAAHLAEDIPQCSHLRFSRAGEGHLPAEFRGAIT